MSGLTWNILLTRKMRRLLRDVSERLNNHDGVAAEPVMVEEADDDLSVEIAP